MLCYNLFMDKEEVKKFSTISRIKSFKHAWRGFFFFIKVTHNSWVEIGAFILGIVLAFYFHITNTEWIALILASGLVFVSEAFNTALEIDMDLTSPEYHPYARDVKDIAAGAVLISVLISILVTLIIFVPYFLK